MGHHAAGHDRGGGGAEETVAQTEEAAIEETARLFVRNLPYAATEADLAAAFGEHGELAEVHLVLDRWRPPWRSASAVRCLSRRLQHGIDSAMENVVASLGDRRAWMAHLPVAVSSVLHTPDMLGARTAACVNLACPLTRTAAQAGASGSKPL